MTHKMRTLQGQFKALLKQLDFQKRKNEIISAEFAYKARRMQFGYEVDYDQPDRMTLVLMFDITQLQSMRVESREAFAKLLLEDVAKSAGWTRKEGETP